MRRTDSIGSPFWFSGWAFALNVSIVIEMLLRHG